MKFALLPCPFCRSNPEVMCMGDQENYAHVRCKGCGASYEGPHIDGWNHRVEPLRRQSTNG